MTRTMANVDDSTRWILTALKRTKRNVDILKVDHISNLMLRDLDVPHGAKKVDGRTRQEFMQLMRLLLHIPPMLRRRINGELTYVYPQVRYLRPLPTRLTITDNQGPELEKVTLVVQTPAPAPATPAPAPVATPRRRAVPPVAKARVDNPMPTLDEAWSCNCPVAKTGMSCGCARAQRR